MLDMRNRRGCLVGKEGRVIEMEEGGFEGGPCIVEVVPWLAGW